MPDMISIAVI